MRSNPQQGGGFKHLFNNLNDAVVKFELVDGEPQILETNDAFCEAFGYESTSVIGEPLNELIVPSGKEAEAQQFDQRTNTGQSNAAVVERTAGEGRRMFVYRGVPYKDRYGFAIYSDITDEMQQQRHLDVLHRVLRHNLRNELTVVMGMADQIVDKTDEPSTQKAAAKIKDTASRLSQLSDEAKTIQQALDEVVSIRPIELQPLADSVLDGCEKRFNSAEITADVPADMTVRANNKLQTVLRSLLDNAIRHNDSPDPQVHLSATTYDSDTIEVAVVDNGPGIPQTEQQIITKDAEITSLDHGSGLGLWVVKWIVEGYGGWLDIETPESGGSIVRLYLNTANTNQPNGCPPESE